MRPKDLKDGMVVEHRNGIRALVMTCPQTGIRSLVYLWDDDRGYDDLALIKDNFDWSGISGSQFDVVKVYGPVHISDIAHGAVVREDLVWERDWTEHVVTIDSEVFPVSWDEYQAVRKALGV